ncbi:MAG TPA: YMGG-like glycine zipper-containing protein [Blastocatellia bacterium]|nr:YMGG-like glycine zipper-containing protein [Blastocatellia bacterium]
MLYSINKRTIGLKKIGAMLLAVMFLLVSLAPASDAQERYHRHRRPSKTKNIAVGTAIGAIGGALIGGRKGALIGAGAGAGTGYGVYKYKKNKYKKRYYSRYR